MSEYFDLSGKVAIVTGGGGGLGHVIAVGLAKHGADVVLVGRTLSKLESVANEIKALGKKAISISADVTNGKEIADMVAEVTKQFGKIDILVNGAGMANRKAAEIITAEEWQQVMELNALGTFICCQAVAREMMKQKSGKIINMSSIRSRFGTSLGGVAYGPSKGAIDSLTRTLACEWGKYNIYVNAIAPSLILTELSRPLFEDPVRKKQNTDRVPLGRMGELDDVVGPVIFLASKASSFVNGQIIPVDGGNSAGFM